MIVELISVGTELLLGNIVNTNANFLSKKCAELGFAMYYQTVVGDNEGRLYEAIINALKRADILIITGGLGPTQDDITKEVVAKVFNRELIIDQHSKNRIKNYFEDRYTDKNKKDNSTIPENNWKQAIKIEGSIVVDNKKGTAPGYIVEDNNKTILLLPGPPSEMISMFNNDIYDYLKQKQDQVFITKMVKLCGIGESRAETMIMDLIEQQDNPTIAPYSQAGEVHFRVTAAADSQEKADLLVEPVLDELRNRFKDNIYTIYEDENLEEVVVKLLKEKKYTLSIAESCTGGLLASKIVNVNGASSVFNEGIITYSNEAKVKHLGVKESTLKKYGAVSSQTAREMVAGVARLANSDTALAVTGLAGPGGGTEEKPVGLVYIASYVKGEILVKELRLTGDRQKIRSQSVVNGLDFLRRNLIRRFRSEV